MSFFDNWKEFCRLAERQKLSTACQAAFYWIIAKFNEADWAEEIELTDRELQRLTQIRSSKTITDVKSRLKLSGLIDFRTSKYYGTTYRLVQLASTSWSNAQGSAQSGAHSKAQSSALPFINYTHNTKEKDERRKDGGTRVRETAADDSEKFCSSSLKNAWIMHSGMNPNDGICMKLGALEQTYGTERVKAAIEEANARNQAGTINFNFVQSVLMRMINGNITKGAVQSDRKRQPSTEGDYKWEDPPDLDKY